MNPETQALFDAALALPEAERTLLVERLLESISPETDELADDQLFAELERRDADFQRDPSSAKTWSDVRDQE